VGKVRKFLRERWRYFDAALALVVIVGSLVYIYDLLVGSRGLDVAYVSRNYSLYLHAVFTNVYATTIAFIVHLPVCGMSSSSEFLCRRAKTGRRNSMLQ